MDAALTRTGVLVYVQPDGTEIREYRPAEEVFKADSLGTLGPWTPVTFTHPPVAVTAENYKTYAVGNLTEHARQDGDLVASSLAIQDGATIKKVDAGTREISCGYECDLEHRAGTTDTGEAYDRIQRNIRYNHVAIVERGRAGSSVALRLDSAGNQYGDTQMNEEELKALKAKLAQAEANVAQEKARADAAESKLAQATARADAAESPATIRKLVEARVALETKGRAVLGEAFKADAADDDIRKDVIKACFPHVKLDGAHPQYLAAMFDLSTAAPEERSDEARTDADVNVSLALPVRNDGADKRSPAERSRDHFRSLGSKPLTISKDSE